MREQLLKPLARRLPSGPGSPNGVAAGVVTHTQQLGRGSSSRARCRAVGAGILALLALVLLWAQLYGLHRPQPSAGWDGRSGLGGSPVSQQVQPAASMARAAPAVSLRRGARAARGGAEVASSVGPLVAANRAWLPGGDAAHTSPVAAPLAAGQQPGAVDGDSPPGGRSGLVAGTPWPLSPSATATDKCASFFGNGFETPFTLLPAGAVGDFRCL